MMSGVQIEKECNLLIILFKKTKAQFDFEKDFRQTLLKGWSIYNVKSYILLNKARQNKKVTKFFARTVQFFTKFYALIKQKLHGQNDVT